MLVNSPDVETFHWRTATPDARWTSCCDSQTKLSLRRNGGLLPRPLALPDLLSYKDDQSS